MLKAINNRKILARHWNLSAFLSQCPFAQRAQLTSYSRQDPPVPQKITQHSANKDLGRCLFNGCLIWSEWSEGPHSLSQKPASQSQSKEDHKVPEVSILQHKFMEVSFCSLSSHTASCLSNCLCKYHFALLDVKTGCFGWHVLRS